MSCVPFSLLINALTSITARGLPGTSRSLSGDSTIPATVVAVPVFAEGFRADASNRGSKDVSGLRRQIGGVRERKILW